MVPGTAFLTVFWVGGIMAGVSVFPSFNPIVTNFIVFDSYDTQKRRKAIALVLEDKLTPSQVARALCYTARSVRLWVREYLVLHPNGPVPESSYTPPSFEPLSTSPNRRMA